MALKWVLFNLTGTLVDPAVLAQPLGDSGADEELVLAALDDTVAMAMADALTGETTPLATLIGRGAALPRPAARRAGPEPRTVHRRGAALRRPPRPYRKRTRAAAAETCFVSTHWWDVAGAKRAGLPTAWVARRERSLLDTVPAPDYSGSDLAEVADAIVGRLAA